MRDAITNDGPSTDTPGVGGYASMTDADLREAGKAFADEALDLTDEGADLGERGDDGQGDELAGGLDALDLEGVVVPIADVIDDEREGDDEVVDVAELLRRVRVAVRDELRSLARRQRERALQELRDNPCHESAGVRKALCVLGTLHGWRDSDIRRAFGVPVATLRRWKADPAFVAAVERARSDREAMRASLRSLIASPPEGTTAGALVDAVKRLEALSRTPLPRTAFQNRRERELWLASL